jgi:hypothetical protein
VQACLRFVELETIAQQGFDGPRGLVCVDLEQGANLRHGDVETPIVTKQSLE